MLKATTMGLIADATGNIKLQCGLSIKSNIRPYKGQKNVLINVIASPINPSDINRIEGNYPVPNCSENAYDLILGGEGIGVVEDDNQSKFVKKGQFVVPARPSMGWWRKTIECGDEDVIPIECSGKDLYQMSMSFVNGPTAYKLLTSFVKLKPGDWIIQNGANSSVGKAIIQFCKRESVHSINIVRERRDFDIVRKELEDLGADAIVKMEANDKIHKNSQQRNCVAGFNCIGGDYSSKLVEYLAPSSPIITYGGMSRRPLIASTGSLIFQDIRFLGFWISRWYENASLQEKQILIKQNDVLKFPKYKLYHISSYMSALEASKMPFKDFKVVMHFAEPSM